MVASGEITDVDVEICEAMRTGDIGRLQKLLYTEPDRDINDENSENSTPPSSPPSHVKSSYNNNQINVNVYDADGWTALHRCCISGNLELLKKLVELGADIKLASRDGWNALHLAAYNGHRDIATFLLGTGSSRA
ncbi:hypothetical protein RvY_09618-2 [Ramazzottius varieornatus]|uniref:Uncharacterized protein n=1 Tax=Ramazzottius varieornatus TaxID=947166 RepID=A0A1D1V9Z8_RAMVA|nr:hypothetical protein RvY_09618-2 [Ramazzottius varieornatus]